MKKVLMMLGVMLFTTAVFAQNAAALSDEECQHQKDQFEQMVEESNNESFLVQNILINWADPMASMADAQAQPLAVCYAKFKVKGVALTQYVRAHADIFRPANENLYEEKVKATYDKLQRELLQFADRVDLLSEQAELDRVIAQGSDSFVLQHILSNMADPMKKMSDEQARPKAKTYAALKVKSMPLVEFVRFHSGDYTMDAEIYMEHFADRVERLSK